MSALVLDSGVLVAVDRGDRTRLTDLRIAQRRGVDLRTNAMVVAQVWRDGRGRQAGLARLLAGVDVRAVTPADGKRAGELLKAAGLADAVDATVALLAGPGDRILTSDPDDLKRLSDAAGRGAIVVPVLQRGYSDLAQFWPTRSWPKLWCLCSSVSVNPAAS